MAKQTQRTFDSDTGALLERLRQRLESGSIMRQDLTRRVGVGQSTIGRWKNGECKPIGTARLKLIEVLDRLDRRLPVNSSQE
jgi:predicted transcriptional regulator